MYQAKRAKDQKLNELRKDVENRKEVADRAEKRVRDLYIQCTNI